MSARSCRFLFLAISLPASLSLATACAKGKSTHPGGGGPDAGGGLDGFVDAGPRADAAPAPDGSGGGGAGPVTLTQSSSMDVVGGNSIACANLNTGFTYENSYYRVFDLAAENVTGDLSVSKVTVAIEGSVSPGGSQTASVVLSTLNGAFTLANLTQLASADVTVPDIDPPSDGQTGGQLIDVPITTTVPAGSKLVVELHSPDGSDVGNALYVGSNNASQTGPTYLAADTCGATQPTDVASDPINAPDMHWVVTVTGQE